MIRLTRILYLSLSIIINISFSIFVAVATSHRPSIIALSAILYSAAFGIIYRGTFLPKKDCYFCNGTGKV